MAQRLLQQRFIPTGDIAADTVQAALAEVDSEKLAKAANLADLLNKTTARGNLEAAKSGTNSDITSLTGTVTATISDWKKVNLVSSDIADFVHFVILLHPRYNATSLALNYCKGTFYLSRGSTNSGHIYCAIEVDTQSVQTLNSGTLTYKTNGTAAYSFELCTCTYQGIEWLGIRTTMPSTNFSNLNNTANFTFVGLHRVSTGSGFALNAIGYFNASTATAVNAEINSSIAAFTPNLPTVIQSAVTVGDLTSSTPQLTVQGSNTGQALMQFKRTVGANATYNVNLGATRFNIAEATNGVFFSGFASPTVAEVFIGEAISTSLKPGALRGGTSTGTNAPGANLTLSSGAGTGNAAPADLIFATPDAIASGTTAQNYTNKGILKGNGNWGFGTLTPAAKAHVAGGLLVTSGSTGSDPGAGNFAISGFIRPFGTDGSFTNIYQNVGGTTALLENDMAFSGTATSGIIRYFRFTNTAIPLSFEIQKGNNTNTINHRLGANQNSFLCADNGNLGIGIPVTTTINPKLHIAGGVAITSSGAAVSDPGAGNFSVAGNSSLNGLKLAYRALTASYALTLNDCVIGADATTGVITITLPTAVGNQGQVYRIKKVDASANAVIIAAISGQAIDAGATYNLTTQYAAVDVISNGSNWRLF